MKKLIAIALLAVSFNVQADKQTPASKVGSMYQYYIDNPAEIIKARDEVTAQIIGAINNYSKQLPQQTDKYTLMQSVNILNNHINYIIVIDFEALKADLGSDMDKAQTIANLNEMGKGLCTQPILRFAMDILDFTVRYTYKAKTTHYFFTTVEVDKTDCSGIALPW